MSDLSRYRWEVTLRELPTQEHLREYFDYDPITGIFVWKKVHYSNIHLLGRSAGYRSNRGYVTIGVPKFGQIGAHRLAWIYVHGSVGGLEVDHRDTNPSNNAIINLRLATSSEQKQNKKVQSNNRCGLKGAYFHSSHRGKKWRSQIRVGEKLIFLGYFHTAQEAHEAYAAAAPVYFGEFYRVAADPVFAERVEKIRNSISEGMLS